ncbi:GNAT family N-acetyltransferase [Vagococcus salmoninarum]|uniref:N-acetyltransferase domain-containing protein n=1 Tax=Vagococcus salmoninarum TaxID=2739 RepID=A0A429ZUZ9_9ENTE|nr:GNAT family N-acetyltransferase [Vagococcus salmoninarum]MBE9390463.1 GNAT family N-acetyltransferase [Vagococcus salmoninarum]RST97576.1 hypothetical protein CBF35_02605 [Vagococcus salmoninarum]
MKKTKLRIYYQRTKKISPSRNNQLKLKTVKWQSKEYIQGIVLRNNSLNRPSGLPLLTSVPLQEESAVHLVAIINGQVVGTLFLDQTERNKVAQIKQVAVSSDYRGQHIGQQLMAYAEKVARQLGYHEVVLNARDSAWLFYEKLGYQSFGETYHNHEMVMQPYRKVLKQRKRLLTQVA